MMPPITVLMSVYNAEKYLSDAIESILNQTFRNFEFLIINDGSTDRSIEILHKYAAADERIRLVNNETNKGLIACLNDGIEKSVGEYIARMDADDISLPYRLEKQYDFLEKHPNYVCVGCKSIMIDPHGEDLKVFPFYGGNEAIVKAMLNGVGGAIIHPSAMIRKSTLLKSGGYNPDFLHAEDMDLFLRLTELGLVANIPEILFKYRQTLSGVGYKNRKLQRGSYWRSIENAYARRGLPFDKIAFKKELREEDVLPYCKWAWWALGAGNVKVARKYAFKTLLRRPFSKESWKILYCSLRGY